MTILQTINHKKNEIQDVEFFKDAECTEAFDFKNAKNLHIEPVGGDCTPIFALSNKLSELGIKARIFTPTWNLGWRDGISPQTPLVTLNDILDGEDSNNVNLSKHIPEDNAVLFLSEEDIPYSKTQFAFNHQMHYPSVEILKNSTTDKPKKITIFLHHGTQSELQKANEVAKELEEKYGVKEVNLFALHCFVKKTYYTWKPNDNNFESLYIDYKNEISFVYNNINKIITTNSTGVLKPQNTERLQVIDCKKMFEEYLNGNN